jgi:hypothetical protein
MREGQQAFPKKAFPEPFRRHASGLLLLLFGGLLLPALCIAFLEAVASLFVSRPTDAYLLSARLNHTWSPNARTVHAEWVDGNPDFPVPYVHVTNRQGWLESYDIAEKKPRGTWRIFYVGDSFTEGTAPMDQSVPSFVEQELAGRATAAGWNVEVINTGTTSYSPMIVYVLVRYILSAYQPDLIVFNVDMTDDYDDWIYHQTALYDRDGNPWAVPPRDLASDLVAETRTGTRRATMLTRIASFLQRHSHVWNLVNSRPRGRGPAPEASVDSPLYQRWSWCAEPWDALTEENAGRTLDLIGRIAGYCRQHGIRLMLTGVPHYPQMARGSGGVPPWSGRPHREIARVARAGGAVYLDSLAALTPLVEPTPHDWYYYSGDMHFNPRGHRIWADAQLAFLLDPRNGLLPAAFYRADPADSSSAALRKSPSASAPLPTAASDAARPR